MGRRRSAKADPMPLIVGVGQVVRPQNPMITAFRQISRDYGDPGFSLVAHSFCFFAGDYRGPHETTPKQREREHRGEKGPVSIVGVSESLLIAGSDPP